MTQNHVALGTRIQTNSTH